MKILEELILRYPQLNCCIQEISDAINIITDCFKSDGKLLICGNGGSCSDSEHMVGELMKGFLLKRPLTEKQLKSFKAVGVGKEFTDKLQGALSAISLTGHPSLSTAYANDVDAEFVYAQQTFGLGKKEDILICISTSGNAKNVYNAAIVANSMGIKTIALTGISGGKLKKICNCTICVPESETFKVQELHLPVYHALCASVEQHFFRE